MEKSVSIIFCGGCNPRIDRGRIASEIGAVLGGYGYQVSFNRRDAAFLIYLSGCLANCAHRYSQACRPGVVVAAATVDAMATDETELVGDIVEKVRNYFAGLENGL